MIGAQKNKSGVRWQLELMRTWETYFLSGHLERSLMRWYFKPRSERSEKHTQGITREKSIPGRGKSRWRSPETQAWVCLSQDQQGWRGVAGRAHRGPEQSRASRSSPRAWELGKGLCTQCILFWDRSHWGVDSRRETWLDLFFVFLFNKCLSIWLCQVLVEALRVFFDCECGIFSGGMWALVPGSNLGPLHWERGILATGQPWKSWLTF